MDEAKRCLEAAIVAIGAVNKAGMSDMDVARLITGLIGATRGSGGNVDLLAKKVLVDIVCAVGVKRTREIIDGIVAVMPSHLPRQQHALPQRQRSHGALAARLGSRGDGAVLSLRQVREAPRDGLHRAGVLLGRGELVGVRRRVRGGDLRGEEEGVRPPHRAAPAPVGHEPRGLGA